MIPLIIGISVGLATILIVHFFGRSGKAVMYGLVLSGIGFLYVGFTWMEINQLVITIIQAMIFVFLAYYGVIRSINMLAIAYILHGVWDLVYNNLVAVSLTPPHYDIFCMAADFVIGGYILLFKKRIAITV